MRMGSLVAPNPVVVVWSSRSKMMNNAKFARINTRKFLMRGVLALAIAGYVSLPHSSLRAAPVGADHAGQTPAGSSNASEAGAKVTLPARTALMVRLLKPVTQRSTDDIDGELTNQIALNEHIVFPKGTRVRGHATITKSPSNRGYLGISLDAIQTMDGKWIEIKTTPVLSRMKSRDKKDGDGSASTPGDGTNGAVNLFSANEKEIVFPTGRKVAFGLTSELVVPR